jgi:carboxymethylenebutenolidase
VQVPLMMHYAGNDRRIDQTIPEFRTLLDEHGVACSLNMYPGTDHGFHNDSSEGRYNAAAATLAWRRTLAQFEAFLG